MMQTPQTVMQNRLLPSRPHKGGGAGARARRTGGLAVSYYRYLMLTSCILSLLQPWDTLWDVGSAGTCPAGQPACCNATECSTAYTLSNIGQAGFVGHLEGKN